MGIFDKFKSIVGSGRARDRTLSITEFRDAFIQAMTRADPTAKIDIIDDWVLRIGGDDPPNQTIRLNNGYAYYLNHPDELTKAIQTLVDGVLEIQDGSLFSVQRDKLVLVVRPMGYGAPDSDIVMWPLAGNLGFMLAVDGKASLAPVVRDSLAELEMEEADALELATQILRSRIGEILTDRIEGTEIHFVGGESGLATGVLALPDVWGIRPGERRAVFVDGRETFLWTDAADVRAVTHLRTYARELRKRDEALGDSLIEFDGRTWRDIGL